MRNKTKPLHQIDFKYVVGLDYHRTSCDGECDYICRCSKIQDSRIESVNVHDVTTHIFENLDYDIKDTLLFYGINRILNSYKIWEAGCWNISVGAGYYGEEIDSVSLDYNTSNKIQESINDFTKLKSTKEKIDFLLELEYGYVLDSIKSCQSYTIQTLNKSDIILGQDSYRKKISKEDFYKDGNYEGIRAVVKNDGDKYRLIDGYHRVLSTDSEEIKAIVIES